MSLKNKVCVISGGGSGIGRALALRMAKDGAKIAVVGRTRSKLRTVKAEIEERGGIANTYRLDVADFEATQAMVKDVVKCFGRIDVLVNNAGDIALHRGLLEITREEIQLTFGSTIFGTIICTQLVVPLMLQARMGTIINVSSISGTKPSCIAGAAYSAAKAAVTNFTRYLNRELRNTGIRACVILPGEVDTPFLNKRRTPPSAEARSMMVAAEDVAEAIFLVARLPQRAMIEELVIRPTMQTDILS